MALLRSPYAKGDPGRLIEQSVWLIAVTPLPLGLLLQFTSQQQDYSQ